MTPSNPVASASAACAISSRTMLGGSRSWGYRRRDTEPGSSAIRPRGASSFGIPATATESGTSPDRAARTAWEVGEAGQAAGARRPSISASAAGLGLELVDLLRGFGLGEVVVDVGAG